MNHTLTTLVEKTGLDEARKQDLLEQFNAFLDQAEEFGKIAMEIKVTDIGQDEDIKRAKEMRVKIGKIRILTEKRRRELKDKSMVEGRAIDSVAKMITGVVEPIETHLKKQEKFIENLAKEHKEKMIAERREKLAPYVDDVSMYTVGDMKSEQFDQLLETCRIAKVAKEKEADEAAKKEKADEAEREKLRIENETLKKDADAKEAELAVERKKTEDADRERVRLENEKEQEEAKKLEAEKVEQENKEKAERAAELAPEKEKLLVFARAIECVSPPLGLVSDDARAIMNHAMGSMSQIAAFIRNKTREL